MPFSLKNVSTTYQRLMDPVFSQQIWRNLKVYVDYMILKTSQRRSHVGDLKDVLGLVRKYNMHINPTKFSFRLQVGKFLSFMLTKRGVEANPNKCQAVIDMRSPANVHEVQQLAGRLITLSRFLSYAHDKAFVLFFVLKNKEKFEWTGECNEEFLRIKTFLTLSLILTQQKEGSLLLPCLSVTGQAMSKTTFPPHQVCLYFKKLYDFTLDYFTLKVISFNCFVLHPQVEHISYLLVFPQVCFLVIEMVKRTIIFMILKQENFPFPVMLYSLNTFFFTPFPLSFILLVVQNILILILLFLIIIFVVIIEVVCL